MDRAYADRAGAGLLAALALLAPAPSSAQAAQPSSIFTVNARLTAGTVWRLEGPDLRLPYALNGAAAGVPSLNGTGANADDANLNFRRHQAVSRAFSGTFEVQARQRDTRALLRVRGWRDEALRSSVRSWGSAANDYAAGQPLTDAGAPPLSRFSGVVVGEAWVEQAVDAGAARLLARVGQQALDWGANAGFPGGLEVLTPRDLPAARRAGAAPADARVPVPMAFGRVDIAPALALEGFYQTHFRPNALEMCGSFNAISDYTVESCDKVMAGLPPADDRTRVHTGAYLKRLPTLKPQAAQFGAALRWQLPAFGLQLGAYHARYTSRVVVPSLRKSSRVGPALIAGDPDGKNLAFFTEYPDAIRLSAGTFTHRGGAYGELSYRPNLPLLIGSGDAVTPFLNPLAPALFRQDADAVAPGGLFHGYERYPMWQAQLGFQRAPTGPSGIGFSAEVVAKHIGHLPQQALRRYGRSDVFGTGPIDGVCIASMTVPALQCSQRGYVTSDALAWRARVEKRLPPLFEGWTVSAALGVVHDVRGWSGDALISEGRRSGSVSLRAEYRQRYELDVRWLPVGGGDYNATADRDVLAVSLGVRF